MNLHSAVQKLRNTRKSRKVLKGTCPQPACIAMRNIAGRCYSVAGGTECIEQHRAMIFTQRLKMFCSVPQFAPLYSPLLFRVFRVFRSSTALSRMKQIWMVRHGESEAQADGRAPAEPPALPSLTRPRGNSAPCPSDDWLRRPTHKGPGESRRLLREAIRRAGRA